MLFISYNNDDIYIYEHILLNWAMFSDHIFSYDYHDSCWYVNAGISVKLYFPKHSMAYNHRCHELHPIHINSVTFTITNIQITCTCTQSQPHYLKTSSPPHHCEVYALCLCYQLISSLCILLFWYSGFDPSGFWLLPCLVCVVCQSPDHCLFPVLDFCSVHWICCKLF